MSGIAKIQNIPSQWIPAISDDGESLQPAQKLTIPAVPTKLIELLNISAGTEIVLVDFYNPCILRFDGQDVSDNGGHKFTVNDHPAFSVHLLPYISIMSSTGADSEIFVSQFAGVC